MNYNEKRESAGRFDAIATWMDDVSGLRVLDFGCLDGYFANRFAEQGAVVTAVDDSQAFNDATIHENVTFIGKHMEPGEIAALGHFDVVLALSVLHHLTSWRKYLAAFKAAGDVVFIETANPDENLPKAKAHNHSQRIVTAVSKLGLSIRQTPGYDAGNLRDLWVIDQRQP